MKAKVLVLGIVVVLMTAVGGWSFQNNAKPAHQPEEKVNGTVFAQKDGLIAIDLAGNAAKDQIAVVDPKARSVAVYQVDRNSGEITLKSVRKIHWDLQLDDYNGSKPSPLAIKSAVQQNIQR